jgi:hypothetical protein
VLKHATGIGGKRGSVIQGQNRKRGWCNENVAKAGRKSRNFGCAGSESHNNRFRVEKEIPVKSGQI